jgi:hypothetical protein
MATDHSHEILKQVQALSHNEQRELVAQIEEGLRAPRPARRKLAELRGLGKEIWAGVDVREYLRKERESWDG